MRAEDVAQVAEMELVSNNALQAKLHHIPPPKEQRKATTGTEPPKEIEDYYVPPSELPVLSWTSAPQLATFEATYDQQTVKFTINSCFSRVSSLYICANLPRVVVLPEYRDLCRVAWTPNIAANLLGTTRVTYGEVTIGEDFPVYADDVERQFNCGKPGQQEMLMRDAGMLPALTEWAEELPHFGPIVASPNFHFTRDGTHCLRPSITSAKSRARIAFRPRQYPAVLRMQVRRSADADWVLAPCNPKYVSIEELPQSEGLDTHPAPYTAKGDCVMVNYEEQESDVDCNESYVNWVKRYETQELHHVGFGETVELTVSQDSVCVAMFLLAYNERATSCGCFSNYTTNPESPLRGLDPIKGCTIYYDRNVARVYDAHHMSSIEPRKCPSLPCEPGYHVVLFCPCSPFSTSPHALRGVVPKLLKMRVEVTLNGYSEAMQGARPDDKFSVVLLMMVVKRLEYMKVEDAGEPTFNIAITG